MKRFLYFFGWAIILGLMIYLGAKYQFFLKQEYMKNLGVGSFVWYSSIFPIVIGMLLRLPELINEIKDKRPWTFDWAKFVGIGLPSMFISLAFVLIFYVPINVLHLIPQQIYLGNPTLQTIAGVVFGFVLLDSVKK